MHGRILLLTLLVATVFFAGCAPQKSEHVVKTVDASLRDTARVTLVKMLANENPSIRANAIEGVQDTLGTDGGRGSISSTPSRMNPPSFVSRP